MKILIIITLLFFLYLFTKKIFFPKLFPRIIRYFIKKLFNINFNSFDMNVGTESNNRVKSDGKVTFTRNDKKKPTDNNANKGEYTDFEEI